MIVVARCRPIRFARAALLWAAAAAGLTTPTAGSANATETAPSQRAFAPEAKADSKASPSAAVAAPDSAITELPAEYASSPQQRNVERVISEALAPPRWRCAELRAAINQAAMDAHGSQSMNAAPQFGRSPHAGPTRLPPAPVGAIDKRSRLEAEYSQLKCARQAP
jgi:hypothetical protein